MTTSRLEIRLLGQFDLQSDGQPQRLPSRPAQSLLAYLALTAGTLHRRERLAGLLWPDATDANARAYLRSALWRVRQALPDPDLLSVDEINLGFNPQAAYWLDTAALEQASAGDCQIPALMAAVELYRGELLPGFYDDWIGPERERLHAVFDQRAQRLVERLVEAQRWPETQTWAEFWIARTPTAEAAYRALMQASGAQDDLAGVAAAYERCRAALEAELAVEPSPATQALLARLRQPAAKPAAAEPARLPIPATPFIGRETELAEAARLLSLGDCRLLTLAGAGGAGKTRLALEAAARATAGPGFPDGVYFVPLAPLNAAEFLASAIAKAVRLDFYGPDEPARQLVRHLRGQRLLLVLDNFEHLLASGGAAQVSELLRQAPGLKLLVTSRERLNLQGEWLLEVGGLALPPPGEPAPDPQAYSATRLFVQAAERAWPAARRQSLSEADRRSVAHICRLVEGLPLALELAADWVRVLVLDEIAAEIEQGLKFLETDTRDLPERHRSLWAVCDHSWRLLSAAEQSVFRRLSIFRGGFTREAAEQVAGATLARLSALAGKSLLHRTPAGRYEVHELLRQYAAARLAEAHETETVAARHRDYYQSFLIQADDIVWGAMEVAHLERLEVEQENLRAALLWSQAHADPEAHLRLVNGLIPFWFVRADYGEGRRWLEDAVARGAGASGAARAAAGVGAGSLAEQQGDYAGAQALLEAALMLRGELGDIETAWAHVHLGRVAMLQGEIDRAVAIYHATVATFRQLGFRPGIANGLMYLGMALYYQGQPAQAENLLAESLPLLREAKDAWAVARALFGLGMVALRRGEPARAMDLLQESLRMARERRDRGLTAECVEAIAFAAGTRSQGEEAARLLGAAESLGQAIGQLRAPGLQPEYERNLSAFQGQMDGAVFNQLWAEGRRLDEAATLLLAESLAAAD